jgi:hypothetical protein
MRLQLFLCWENKKPLSEQLNSQEAFIRFIALYPDSDALDDDDDNDDGSDDKSYEDAQDDNHNEDNVHKVVFVEILFAEVPFLAFADKYFLGSLSNSLHLDYSILCGDQKEGHVPK